MASCRQTSDAVRLRLRWMRSAWSPTAGEGLPEDCEEGPGQDGHLRTSLTVAQEEGAEGNSGVQMREGVGDSYGDTEQSLSRRRSRHVHASGCMAV